MVQKKPFQRITALAAVALFFAAQVPFVEAKLDCGPTANKSDRLAAHGGDRNQSGRHRRACDRFESCCGGEQRNRDSGQSSAL